MRVASSMASAWSWVTKSAVKPKRRCMANSSMRNDSRTLASTLDSGSSNSTTLELFTSARARATRCCCPPLS